MNLIANRYQIMSKIGHGSMGVVYKVLDRLTDQEVALKHVAVQRFSSSQEDPERLNQLRFALAHEFSTLVPLRHPHIITVLDYGFDEMQIPFFTMTLLEDALILSEAVDTNIALEDLVRLVTQILLALHYLHQRGIIHRDLKPANIMVLGDQIKLLDFGLARTRKISRKGIGGTLRYMAPEFFKRVRASIQSDLFALGVILYEIVVGHPPYDPEDIMERMQGLIDLDPLRNHPLEAVILRLLAAEPHERYANAMDVIDVICRETNTPPPVETDAIIESFLQTAPFVGRTHELNHLKTLLDEAQKGQGALVLIGGESGVGKSRLIEELRTHALVAGITVLRGQGVDSGGLPFQLWRDALPRLLLSSRLSSAEIGALSALVPRIKTLVDHTGDEVIPLETTSNQQQLVFTIVDLLRRQEQPLLILMEDLQWTIESLEPLKHIVPFIQDVPVLILGTYRNDEKPNLPDEFGDVEVMTLRRFDKQKVMELSSAMLGEVGTHPDIVDFLQRETEGNAFFLVEVVRALADSAGRLADVGRMTLPDHMIVGGIREAMRRRLNQIPQWGQGLLRQAAIAGRRLDLNVMQRLVQDQPIASHRLDDWLSVCSDYAVLEYYEEEWRFTHDKLREFVLNDLDTQQRPVLYQEVAEVVESIYGDDASWAAVLFELWQHTHDTEKEVFYLLQTLEQFITYTGNYVDGNRLTRYGLQKLDDDDPHRARLLNYLSKIMWRTGDYEQAHQYASEALRLAEVHDYTKAFADAMNNLGNIYYYQGKHREAIRHYQQGADKFMELGDLVRGAFDLINIGWTYCTLGELEAATQYIDRGMAISTEIGDAEGIALGHYTRGLIASREGRYEASIRSHEVSLNYYKAIKSPWLMTLNLVNLGFVYLQQNHDASAETLHEALDLCGQYGQEGLMLETIIGFAMLYSRRGDLEQAAALAGMVLAHPAFNSDAQDRLDPLLLELRRVMDSALDQQLSNGRTQDFDVTVTTILDEFANEADP